MADPLILFSCHTCGRSEGLPLDTLQLVGKEPWLRADDWFAERGGVHRVRCAPCWLLAPLAPPDQVQEVTVRPH